MMGEEREAAGAKGEGSEMRVIEACLAVALCVYAYMSRSNAHTKGLKFLSLHNSFLASSLLAMCRK